MRAQRLLTVMPIENGPLGLSIMDTVWITAQRAPATKYNIGNSQNQDTQNAGAEEAIHLHRYLKESVSKDSIV